MTKPLRWAVAQLEKIWLAHGGLGRTSVGAAVSTTAVALKSQKQRHDKSEAKEPPICSVSAQTQSMQTFEVHQPTPSSVNDRLKGYYGVPGGDGNGTCDLPAGLGALGTRVWSVHEPLYHFRGISFQSRPPATCHGQVLMPSFACAIVMHATVHHGFSLLAKNTSCWNI
jgi:hypothetical protein